MAYPMWKIMCFSLFFFFFWQKPSVEILVKLSIWIPWIKIGYTFMFHISWLHLLRKTELLHDAFTLPFVYSRLSAIPFPILLCNFVSRVCQAVICPHLHSSHQRGLLVFGGLSLGKFPTLLCHIARSANAMLFWMEWSGNRWAERGGRTCFSSLPCVLLSALKWPFGKQTKKW